MDKVFIVIIEKSMKISQNKLKQFKNDGFIKLSGFLNPKKIPQIREDLEKFIVEFQNKLGSRQVNFTDGDKINSMHDLSKWKWISKIQNKKSTQSLIEKLLGEKIRNFGAELFYKPSKSGIAVPAHQDNYYWCMDDPNAVTVWIALEKANKNNGGIYYYKKSHHLGLLEHEPSLVPGSSQKIKNLKGLDLFNKIYPSLQPGDCLIHHSLVVHGSLKNNSNLSRVGITLRFVSEKSNKDKFLMKRYELELKNQIKKRLSK